MSEFTAPTNDDTYLPAFVATGIWLAVGAVLDAYLVATHKKRLITDVLRTKPGIAFLAVLCLHVANRLGRIDPFRFVAAGVRSRFPDTQLADVLQDK